MRWRDESGQSTVELVAMLPMIATAAIATGQLLAAGAAREVAGHAAQAAAMAQLQGGDPSSAAEDAAPAWARDRMRIELKGRRAFVTVPPLTVVPGIAQALTATAHADSGPRP